MSDWSPLPIVGALPHNANEKRNEMPMPASAALDRYSLVLKFLFKPINSRNKAVDNNVSSGVRAVQSISS